MELTPDYLVSFLNEINRIDPTVLPKLINYRVECNNILAGHPTVQVRKTENIHSVGFLGILNGLLPTLSDGYGQIAVDCTLEPHTLNIKDIHKFIVLKGEDHENTNSTH